MTTPQDIVVNDALIKFEAHELSKRPSRMITVVDPTSVRIQLNGDPALKVLEEGREYTLTLVLIYIDPVSGYPEEIVQVPGFDFDLYPITATHPINQYFDVVEEFAAEDELRVIAKPIPDGASRQFTIAANFKAHTVDGAQVYVPPHDVTGTLDIVIFAPITITPPNVLLPLGEGGIPYVYSLTAAVANRTIVGSRGNLMQRMWWP
jgi:hypothetical protein